MSVMTQADFDRAVNIRTASRAKLAIDRVVANLKAGQLRWGDGRVTKEAVVNASWLWLEDLPEEFLERVMERYLARLEALMGGEPDPGGFPGGLPVMETRDAGVVELPPERPVPRRKVDRPARPTEDDRAANAPGGRKGKAKGS
jgi:hypothetical protein